MILQTVQKVFLDHLSKEIKNMLILHDKVFLEQLGFLANKSSLALDLKMIFPQVNKTFCQLNLCPVLLLI